MKLYVDGLKAWVEGEPLELAEFLRSYFPRELPVQTREQAASAPARARGRPKKRKWISRRVTEKVSETRSVPLAGKGGSAPFDRPMKCSACGKSITTKAAWGAHDKKHRSQGLGTARLVDDRSASRDSPAEGSPGAPRTD